MSAISKSDQPILLVDPDRARRASWEVALKTFQGSRFVSVGSPAEAQIHLDAGQVGCIVVALDPAWPTQVDFAKKVRTTAVPLYALVKPAGFGQYGSVDVDGILVEPFAPHLLHKLLAIKHVLSPEQTLQQLRDMFGLSLLGSESTQTMNDFVTLVKERFSADDCVLWGPVDELDRTAFFKQRETPERSAEVLILCQRACASQSPMITTTDWVTKTTLVSCISLGFGQGPGRGGLAVLRENGALLTHQDRDALQLLAKRVGLEMTWVTAHERLASQHEALRESALLDPLLGVWNRVAFEETIVNQIQVAARRNENLALAIVDIVGLRNVNERFGHAVGDQLLSQLTRLVRTNLRSHDFVGRFGGDELALLLVNTSIDRASRAIEHIQETLNGHPLIVNQTEVPIPVKIGLTLIRNEEASGEAAFVRALTALRRCKGPGSLEIESSNTTSDGSDAYALLGSIDVRVGSTLGGMYRILHEISRGAMGVVYRGEDMGLGRPVAIKVLRSDLANDKDLVSRFRDEAALLASILQRNLVQVYSFGQQGEEVYFVMELVEGEPLSDVIKRLDDTGEYVDQNVVATITEEIADALEAIHSLGIVHRDVKPSNVLLDRVNERAVLVDVGVAKRRNEAPDAAGTPGFAAPESFMDIGETPATDVYGLAATIYTTLTGIPPFGGGDLMSVIQRQLNDKPAAASEMRPDLSPAVDAVLLKALAPEPHKRFASASSFAVALTRALARDSKSEWSVGLRRKRKSNQPLDGATATFHARAATNLPLCRGVIYRVAMKVLGQRLGASWLKKLQDSDPDLADLMKPTLAPMSWRPLYLLHGLLSHSGEHGDEPLNMAYGVGRAVVSATFPRFLGADPATLTPSAVLRAVESVWPRYHNWCNISISEIAQGEASANISPGPDSVLVCGFLSGTLARMVEMAGAKHVVITHPQCVNHGAAACVFDLQWAGDNSGSWVSFLADGPKSLRNNIG